MDNFFMNTVIRDTKGLMNYFSTDFVFNFEDSAKRFKVYFAEGVKCGDEDSYYLSELNSFERLSVARRYKPVMKFVEVEILKTRYNVYYKIGNETKRETVMLKTSDVDFSVQSLIRLLYKIFSEKDVAFEKCNLRK